MKEYVYYSAELDEICTSYDLFDRMNYVYLDKQLNRVESWYEFIGEL